MVDPVAFQLIGFDRATERFRYAVNPSFGQPVAMKLGVLDPFRVVLRVRASLGPSPAVQLLDRIRPPGPAPARGGAAGGAPRPDPEARGLAPVASARSNALLEGYP
ncbi:MAG: hypothetical protein ACYC3Q_03510 [Gemmatimonadaceae bacterium]